MPPKGAEVAARHAMHQHCIDLAVATGRTPAAWSAEVGGRVDCGRPLLATPQNARHKPQGALQPTRSWGTAVVFTSQGLLRRCEPWAAPVTRALACHPVPVGVASAAKVCPKEKRRWWGHRKGKTKVVLGRIS